MKILLSNDDGYHARGLQLLAAALRRRYHVIIVAPDRNRSGASSSLTLTRPVYVERVAEDDYIVQGTPTDCVHLALTGLLDTEVDMVVAGVNAGSNLGDDTLYSGTVAAAMEGRFLAYPPLAFSLAQPREEGIAARPTHFETAVHVAEGLIERVIHTSLCTVLTVLNVNIPDVPQAQLAGWQVTHLGHRDKPQPSVPMDRVPGHLAFWIGKAGRAKHARPGTDFYAIANNYVSITPLMANTSDYANIDNIRTIIEHRED